MLDIFAPKGKLFRSLLLFGVLGAVVNFPEGYSNAYPNTSYKSFQELINGTYVKRGSQDGISSNLYQWVWSAVLNVWFIGYLIGTFLTPYCTETFGRKNALLISNIVALIGSIMSFLGVTVGVPELFFLSRIVASISSGISLGSLILFLQETAATEYRGMATFLSETTFILTTVMGIGFGMDAVFGKNLPWLTGFSIIPAVISILMTIPLKETPKYLLLKKNNREAAREALEFYQGAKPENEEILDEYLLEEKEEKKNRSIIQQVLFVLRTPHLRTAFLIGSLSLQCIAGSWPIIYLSTDILDVNFPEDISQLVSFAFILANFLAGLAGMLIIERFGRRTLLLSLGAANTFCLACFVACDLLTSSFFFLRWGSVLSLVFFGITYGIALGPIAFFITSEIVVQEYRSLVQSMVFAFNTCANCIFSFATLPAYNAIHAWAFVPLFIIPSIISLLYLYFNMPEPKGREVHEVVEELMMRSRKKNKVIDGNLPLEYGSMMSDKKKENSIISNNERL